MLRVGKPMKWGRNLLFNPSPLQLDVLLEFVDFQRSPRAFTELGILFETGVDELLNGLQLLGCCSGNLIPDYGLLECDERELRVMFGGEEAVVGRKSGFVGSDIKLPCFVELLVENRITLAEKERVCLRRGEANDFPQGFGEEVGDCGLALFGWGFTMVVKPFLDSLQPN